MEGEEGAPCGSGLSFRNAFSDWDYVPSRLVARGEDGENPTVTIAITVFRRFELLVEAVESALAQDSSRTFEIIVVDDDPASDKVARLLERLPALEQTNFRYYVNKENLGLFGNWNRCIQLARGEWMTILNDDDLLHPDYLRLMFQILDRKPEIDGLTCRKRVWDQRPGAVQDTLTLPHRLMKWPLVESSYRGRSTRRIRPRKLFWEPMLGNGAGFIFRRRAALDIGGYYPEEFPASDWWFFVRFSKRYHLRQHRKIGAVVRVAENESAKLSTVKQGLLSEYMLQQALAGSDVPRWWRRLSPLIIAHHRAHQASYWRVDLPASEVEQMLNIRLPADRPRLCKGLKVLFGVV